MALKIGVLGARGRVGSVICEAVSRADDLELMTKIAHGDSLESLIGCDVAVDFTHPDVVMDNLKFCIANGVSAVVGTTGFDQPRLDLLRDWLHGQPVGVLIAPNFSIGAVLMMRYAAEAVRFFESAEIVEMHHPNKVDAPSGTALHTSALLGDVPIHSIRMHGYVSSQEVLLGNLGERLTIRHDSLDRSSFVPGVLLAVRRIGGMIGLTVGLDALVG